MINQKLIISTTNPLMESAHVDKTLREHLRVTIQIKKFQISKRNLNVFEDSFSYDFSISVIRESAEKILNIIND